MKKISIIIPVYNCGSDDSIEIAQKYIKEYSGPISFKFLSTESNSGPGAARNLGIKHATGEYVAFLDSDDTLESSFCEKLYSSAKEYNTDITYCNLRSVIYENTSEVCKNPVIENGIFSYENKIFFLTHFVSYFTTYLYRRDFLLENKISFPATRSSEDSCFLACALLSAQRVSSVAEPLYNYLIRENSLTCSKDTTRYKDKLQSFNTLLNYAKQKNLYDKYHSELDFLYIKKGYLITIFNYIVNNENIVKSDLKETFITLKENVPNFKKNKYLKSNLLLKLLITSIKISPCLASKVISYYAKRKRMKL